ncbi:Tetratricopeptide repeat-like superfamily protein [Heracleum sosnowskyi]|uniref:Tetratricopeptide repeat-like superfamily protein n=1 Tax=Heracleum sosnowskyi TaxID=360622 RepID=A0AAD8N634_9APIA|nr:Tetratricopeptide repeat-like superfamily protein [Heracleum sosnowskyi]
MKPVRVLTVKPTAVLFAKASSLSSNVRWVHQNFGNSLVKYRVSMGTTPTHNSKLSAPGSYQAVVPDIGSHEIESFDGKMIKLEEGIEKVIYGCRFLAILAVLGSLVGSFLCFIKGCAYVVASFGEYMVNRSKVIVLLLEAIDVYLLGTVMLVFGMGLYELFISNLDMEKYKLDRRNSPRSNLLGLFTLKERPRWLEIKSVNALKTKLGHVIVMLLLIGLLEKSKKALIISSTDLLCFSASILLSSGCLFLLSKLNGSK